MRVRISGKVTLQIRYERQIFQVRLAFTIIAFLWPTSLRIYIEDVLDAVIMSQVLKLSSEALFIFMNIKRWVSGKHICSWSMFLRCSVHYSATNQWWVFERVSIAPPAMDSLSKVPPSTGSSFTCSHLTVPSSTSSSTCQSPLPKWVCSSYANLDLISRSTNNWILSFLPPSAITQLAQQAVGCNTSTHQTRKPFYVTPSRQKDHASRENYTSELHQAMILRLSRGRTRLGYSFIGFSLDNASILHEPPLYIKWPIYRRLQWLSDTFLHHYRTRRGEDMIQKKKISIVVKCTGTLHRCIYKSPSLEYYYIDYSHEFVGSALARFERSTFNAHPWQRNDIVACRRNFLSSKNAR